MTIREISIALVLSAVACFGSFLLWRARSTTGRQKQPLRVTGALVILFVAFESLQRVSRRESRT